MFRRAERHVAEGERNIARQRAIIAQLDRDGHNSSDALMLLYHFEQIGCTLPIVTDCGTRFETFTDLMLSSAARGAALSRDDINARPRVSNFKFSLRCS